MNRTRIAASLCALGATLALALGLATPSPSTAQTAEVIDYGSLVRVPELDAVVKQVLSGVPPQDVLVEKLPGGLTAIVIPAGDNGPMPRLKVAKNLINCAIYVGLFEPDFGAGILAFDAAPLADFEYRAGSLVYNTSTEAIEAKLTLKTKGPGQDLKIDATVSYQPQAFTLVFGTWIPGWEAGLHSIEAKVKGAKPGKVKNNFCAGCPF